LPGPVEGGGKMEEELERQDPWCWWVYVAIAVVIVGVPLIVWANERFGIL